MAKFYDQGGLGYHVNGEYIQCVDQYGIDFSSTYEHSLNPNDQRELFQFNLDYYQLSKLIEELTKIRDSGNRL